MMMSCDDDDNGCGDGGWINLILEGVYYLTLAEIHGCYTQPNEASNFT